MKCLNINFFYVCFTCTCTCSYIVAPHTHTLPHSHPLHTHTDDFNVERVSSHNILRLFGFGTCLIRLLGAAFSTLRMARYKEFLKQVGRTIRYVCVCCGECVDGGVGV